MSLPWLQTLHLGKLVTPGRQNPPWKCWSELPACGGLGNAGRCAVEVLGNVHKSGRDETMTVQKLSPEGALMHCSSYLGLTLTDAFWVLSISYTDESEHEQRQWVSFCPVSSCPSLGGISGEAARKQPAFRWPAEE